MIPLDAQRAWESAYRLYAEASETARGADVDPLHVGQMIASTSWEVAESWRAMATTAGLPWCVVAALHAAAAAFEDQAHEWSRVDRYRGGGPR
ncbi:hypothetical protein ACFPM7_26910 [Actinokineospora guangxiensis]|uniref:Uncharacterized protein n=1 Tax=Actinokineospora guangxiensis TaxID=1490288 RepID=A0ABW0EWZ5_9PSEU